ncbi:MAG: hypothetical protein AMXMBFR4_34280 [Candidatus Hydrogenedentota bacterium]
MGDLAKAVKNGISNEFVNWANKFGKKIVRPVTTSQIRNIFGTIKKLEMSSHVDLPELLLLKPRIAYAVRRNSGLQELAEELTTAIDAVDEARDEPAKLEERFRRFCQGFEAILAYHRAHGGN